jgi:hypothetical protein
MVEGRQKTLLDSWAQNGKVFKWHAGSALSPWNINQKYRLHLEQKTPLELPVRENGEFIEVTIPQLELWGILKFT